MYLFISYTIYKYKTLKWYVTYINRFKRNPVLYFVWQNRCIFIESKLLKEKRCKSFLIPLINYHVSIHAHFATSWSNPKQNYSWVVCILLGWWVAFSIVWQKHGIQSFAWTVFSALVPKSHGIFWDCNKIIFVDT